MDTTLVFGLAGVVGLLFLLLAIGMQLYNRKKDDEVHAQFAVTGCMGCIIVVCYVIGAIGTIVSIIHYIWDMFK